MSHESDWSTLRTAAVVCRKVAIERAPILYAERSEPDEEVDSGQFACRTETEDSKEAQVWALGEVMDSDHSLAPYVDLPPGTILSRESPEKPWVVSRAG